MPVVEQKLGADEPDTFTDRGIETLQLGGVGDVEQNANRRPIQRHRRSQRGDIRTRTGGRRRLQVALELHACVRAGIEDQDATMRIDERVSGKLAEVDAESDDGRHPARPGEHRHVARRTALRQRQTPALRPIDGKETRRRQIGRGHDGARWNLGNRIRPRESRQDAVAELHSPVVEGDRDSHKGQRSTPPGT